MNTELVGILNITPDSFSDGGLYDDPLVAIERAKQLFTEGAALIDIGAESTRPNAVTLTAEQEWKRLEPVLRPLLLLFPGKISVDSYHPETIERAFAIAPIIVNDVTGMNNQHMVEAVIKCRARVIVSHLPGVDIAEAHAFAEVSDILQVRNELLQKAAMLEKLGLSSKNIVLDPGIGFGKTMELNAELLKFAKLAPDYDVMIGYSRKRFLGSNRMDLSPNLAAGRLAIAAGTRYLRVHDVAGHQALFAR